MLHSALSAAKRGGERIQGEQDCLLPGAWRGREGGGEEWSEGSDEFTCTARPDPLIYFLVWKHSPDDSDHGLVALRLQK